MLLRAFVLLACVSAIAVAQEATPAQPHAGSAPIGKLVRFQMTDGSAFRARLLSVDRDTLSVAFGTRFERYPTSQVVSVSERLLRDWEKGVMRGLKVGGSIGAVILVAGAAADLSRACRECMMPITFVAIPLGMSTTIAGGVLGGLFFAPSIWAAPHPLPPS
jgi:hypothetical protein